MSLQDQQLGPGNVIKATARPKAFALAAAMVGAAAGALAIVLLAGGGASALGKSLTVVLPPATTDKIYASPIARGRPIVVLDPGHGGRDPGARGVASAAAEKDLTLALARELRDRLVERGRVRVAMTRDSDRSIGLDDRSAVARRLNAAMFVSLHMDSAANPLARGASVYSLSDIASDAEAAAFATSLNSTSRAASGEGSVEALLSDLVMRAQMSASANLAMRMVGRSSGGVALRPDPHRFAAFHVLRRAGAPAVLFEAGYLSNIDDEALLRSPKYRSALVRALADAIEADVAVRSTR
ncbi:MAG: N-acetylmuramoyl-L-alanine amidase [Sphingomicrobium sp.]